MRRKIVLNVEAQPEPKGRATRSRAGDVVVALKEVRAGEIVIDGDFSDVIAAANSLADEIRSATRPTPAILARAADGRVSRIAPAREGDSSGVMRASADRY